MAEVRAGRRTLGGRAPSQRVCADPRPVADAALPRVSRHRLQCRGDRRPAARRPPDRGADEPAVFGNTGGRAQPARRRPAPCPLRRLNAAAGRPAGDDHLGPLRAGRYRGPSRSPGALRLHHGDRRPRLRQARHRLRHPPHRAGARRRTCHRAGRDRPRRRCRASCSMPSSRQVPKRQPIAPAPIPAGPARDLFGKPVAPKPEKRRGSEARIDARDAAVPRLGADFRTHGRDRPGRTRCGRARRRSQLLMPATPALTRRGGRAPCGCRARSSIRRRWSSPPPWPPCRIRRRRTARCCRSAWLRRVSSPTPSSRASYWRERRIHGISRLITESAPSGRPSTAASSTMTATKRRSTPPSSPRKARRCRSRCVSAGAGCWATAPAAARAGRSPPLSSTTACAAGKKRSGSRSPTSCWRTQAPRLDGALGGLESDVIPLGNFRQGMEIPVDAGILFATYATLRSPSRPGQALAAGADRGMARRLARRGGPPRLRRRDRLRRGACHGQRGGVEVRARRDQAVPARKGGAQRLQNALPDARIAYVSATGATTVPGLAYAGTARPLGRRRDAVREAHRVRLGHGGGRRRRDGGRRPRSEGARALPGAGAGL